MGICEQVAEAASGIGSAVQSPVGRSLLSTLDDAIGALGAVDAGIRLGSGGQVGVTDLPGLLNTPGIPCYSPELGDTIYVTPAQWWSRMSCDGLRDPDREELQRRIEDLQRQAEARNRIRDAGYEIDNNFQVSPEMENFLNNLPPPNEGFNTGGNVAREMMFLTEGILNLKNITSSWSTQYAWGWITGIRTTNNSSDAFTIEQEIPIFPGDRIRANSQTTRWSRLQKGLVDERLVTWPEGGMTRINSIDLYKTNGEIINLGGNRRSSSFSNAPQEFYSRFTNWGFSGMGGYGRYATLNFQPNGAPQDPNGFTPSYPINPGTSPEPPEEPCMGGCSCGQMAGQNQRLNQNLERLIKEIHKAIGADKFAGNGYPFQPETLIEKQGKIIYAKNPGRGGTITVGNLLEAVSALISANYHRSGLHRFPAKVPDSLIPNSNDTVEAIDRDAITLNDAMEFQKWWFDQWEAATGEYPIKYEITDDGKPTSIRLWNQSEVLAEIFGMCLKIQEDADLGVQWGVRGATEGSKAGNAALKTLHLLQEFVKFSGALTSNGNDDFIKTTCTFSPDPTLDPSNAEEMLKPSAQDIQVTNIVDGRSLLGILMNINYWAQIAGRANFGNMGAANPLVQTPGQNMNMPGDGIKEMRKKERANDKKWDEWKLTKQQPTTVPAEQQPPGGLPTPNIVEIPRSGRQNQ